MGTCWHQDQVAVVDSAHRRMHRSLQTGHHSDSMLLAASATKGSMFFSFHRMTVKAHRRMQLEVSDALFDVRVAQGLISQM